MSVRASLSGCLIVAACILSIPVGAAAKTISVDDDNPADFRTVQAAIDAAKDGDTIEIRRGVYIGDGNSDIDFLGKGITVRGTDPNDPDIVANTVIDCEGSAERPRRGFCFRSQEGEDSVLAGLTIKNGYGPVEYVSDDSSTTGSAGGAIYSEDSSPTVRSCVTTSNSAEFGGALFAIKGAPTLDSCQITANGSYRSAIYFYRSRPVLSSCTISDNDTRGIYCTRSRPVVIGCVISDNDGSGLVAVRDNLLTVSDCRFSRNGVSGGRAISCGDETISIITRCILEDTMGGFALVFGTLNDATISDCIIRGNHEGGIYGSYHSNLTVRNCTITDNRPAIEFYNHAKGSLDNCILWGNDEPVVRLYLRSRLSISFSDVQGGPASTESEENCTLNWGYGNIEVDPLLDDSGHISIFSPCFNMGDPYYVAGSDDADIDGEARVVGRTVDIGADEVNVEGPSIRVYPYSLEVTTDEGVTPEPQTIGVQNSGSGQMDWRISEDCPWLEVSPKEGDSSGEFDGVNLSFETSQLSTGVFRCQLKVQGFGALNSPQFYEVRLHVRSDNGILEVPTAYPTIQSAIDYASDGETVVVSDGIYTGIGNRDIDFLGKAITVRSASGPDNCVINCNGKAKAPHRAFIFCNDEDDRSVLRGFTIVNGCALGERSDRNAYGGAITCDQSSPTITDCIFAGNRSSWDGGAIHNFYCSPKVRNCRFIGNQAIGNDGGAMNNEGGAPIISHCTFIGNRAYDWGGGIRNTSGSSVSIANCLFAFNRTQGSGGAIFNFAATAEIANCTFSMNVAGFGSAIGSWNGSNVTIANSIIWGNEPVQIWGSCDKIFYSNIEGGWDGIGNIDADPCFADPGYWDTNGTAGDANDDFWIDGDYHLKSQAGRWDVNEGRWTMDEATSPCIDAGDPMMPVGLEGFPNGGIVNMGSYGGTSEASKSYFRKPPCETIIGGDINGDCAIDFRDFQLMALHWCENLND